MVRFLLPAIDWKYSMMITLTVYVDGDYGNSSYVRRHDLYSKQKIIDNEVYIGLYYPVDDTLRNERSLTLVSPIYVKHMSEILKLIFFTLKIWIEENDASVPDKVEVVKLMKNRIGDGEHNYINLICEESVHRLIKLKLSEDNRRALMWDLVNRIPNANIGQMVKQDRLNRVNDVSFRKRLAVKCGTANV